MKRVLTKLTNKAGGPITVVIARGEDIRHFFIRPWHVAAASLAVVALVVFFGGAAVYLRLQGIETEVAFPQHVTYERREYEDRIETLRAEIDRLTSQRLLDRQQVQREVDKLLERQETLSRRYAEYAPPFDGDDLKSRAGLPVPSPRPDTSVPSNAYFTPRSSTVSWPLRDAAEGFSERNTNSPEQISWLTRSLDAVEIHQHETLRTLTRQTYEMVGAIGDALERTGVVFEDGKNLGGPFLPPQTSLTFEEQILELDLAIAMLEEFTDKARDLPLWLPVENAAVTSRFGTRRDPILGRQAHHSGIDFQARTGTPVRAAGAGRVTRAGWNGGYGRMVEVDHGNGFVTRYAHLSMVKVAKGARVSAGTIVGLSGNSGRTTGPHLHYEVRKKGKATDPTNFIDAGRHIAKYL